MKTYQFESTIQGNGTILLPTFLNNLRNRRVKCILIDPDQWQNNPVERLQEITRQYKSLDEPDIEMTETRLLLGALGQASPDELDYTDDIYGKLFSR